MLTEKDIKNLAAQDKRYRRTDSNGLLIEVMPSGTKYWRIRKDKTFITLGKYPDINLREARILAGRPVVKEVLFKDIANDWFERQEWSDVHRKDVRQKMSAYILPRFAKAMINDITRLDILEEVRKIETRGHYETCKKVIGVYRMIFDYAIICGYCENNPAMGIQKAIKTAKHKPMSALTKPEDIKRLIIAMKEYSGHEVTKLLMFWSAYTFARPGECRNAEWSEINFEDKLWVIPAARMKMRQEHIVPLPRQCLDILERLKELDYSKNLLFPSLRPSKALSENAVLSALRAMGFSKEEMTAHGFRAMASTTLNGMGYRSDLIEKSLAHGDKDKIRAVYNRAEYIDERREMLQYYADWLNNLDKKIE